MLIKALKYTTNEGCFPISACKYLFRKLGQFHIYLFMILNYCILSCFDFSSVVPERSWSSFIISSFSPFFLWKLVHLFAKHNKSPFSRSKASSTLLAYFPHRGFSTTCLVLKVGSSFPVFDWGGYSKETMYDKSSSMKSSICFWWHRTTSQLEGTVNMLILTQNYFEARRSLIPLELNIICSSNEILVLHILHWQISTELRELLTTTESPFSTIRTLTTCRYDRHLECEPPPF